MLVFRKCMVEIVRLIGTIHPLWLIDYWTDDVKNQNRQTS